MIDTKQMAKCIFEEYANFYSEVDIEKLAKHLDEIKAEAIKEFAERLHCHCESIINDPWNEKVYPNSWACAYQEFEDVIDNLVKEMVGDTE